MRRGSRGNILMIKCKDMGCRVFNTLGEHCLSHTFIDMSMPYIYICRQITQTYYISSVDSTERKFNFILKGSKRNVDECFLLFDSFEK